MQHKKGARIEMSTSEYGVNVLNSKAHLRPE